MRQSTGTINTFRFMIVFILIFASFLTIAISYNKVIRMKNESLLIIEKYEGVTEQSLRIINNFLYQNGYRSTSTCEDDEVGMKDIAPDAAIVLDNRPNERYYYCLKKYEIKKQQGSTTANTTHIYYDLKLFFKFELDLFDGIDLMNFHIQSETKRIVYHSEINYIEVPSEIRIGS